MFRASIIFSVLVFGAISLFGQDDLAQYQTWMKAAAGASRAARTATEPAAITAAAKTMDESFTAIADFWTKKSKPEAAAFAKTAADAAKAYGAATSPDDQKAALGKIGGTCGGCHAISRDGNNFKM